jgi:hypothetical protein
MITMHDDSPVVAIEGHMLCRISGSRTHIHGCYCVAMSEAIVKEREEACQADRHTQEWQESMADQFPAVPARWHNGKIVFDFPDSLAA